MNSEIQALLNKNTMSDLKRFIKQRQTLNSANWYLKYFFHSVQAAGLLTTSISKHMLESIAKIKNGTYVDEDILIDTEEDEKKSHGSTSLATAPAPITIEHIDVSSPI